MPLTRVRDGRDRDVHDRGRGRRPPDRARVSLRLGDGVAVDARHVVLALAGGFVVVAGDLLRDLLHRRRRSSRCAAAARARRCSARCSWALLLGGLWRDGWMIVRLPFRADRRHRSRRSSTSRSARRGQSLRSRVDSIDRWERYAPDRYVIRVLAFPVVWARRRRLGRDRPASPIALLAMAPITTMRQVYMLWCYCAARRRRPREGPARARRRRRGRRASTCVLLEPLARALRRRVRAQARPAADDRDVPAVAHRDVAEGRRSRSSTSTCSRTSSTAPRSASTTRPARSSTTRRRSATACGCGPRCCRPRSPRRCCARAATRARAACAS